MGLAYLARKERGGRSFPRDIAWAGLLLAAWWIASTFASVWFRGGDSSAAFWAIKGPVVVPFLAYAAASSVRTPKDCGALLSGWVLGVALKCMQALFCYFVVWGGDLGEREYLITHAASYQMSVVLLLAVGAALFEVKSFPRVRIAATAACAVVLPAFVLNERRIEMVGLLASLALGFGFAVLRKPMRTLIIGAAAIPVGFLGFLASSQSQGFLGAPARMLLSLFDDTNASNRYREIENFNLVTTLRAEPLFGTGPGRRFIEALPLDDISAIYEFYLVNPHNSILWVWSALGAIGFALFSALFLALAWRGSRGMALAHEPWRRLVLFLALANGLRFLVFSYGDMLLFNTEGNVILGMSMGLVAALWAPRVNGERTSAAGAPAPAPFSQQPR